MIDEKYLNRLYEGFIDSQILSTKQLKEYGFHAYDLTKLLNDDVIVREKRGYYSLTSADCLFDYGKKLLVRKEYDRADVCFKRCYELNPNHFETCFQLFFKSIKAANYEESFQYFDILYQLHGTYCQNDYNYYLYLLNCVTEIPEKYRKCIQGIQFKDIKIPFESSYAGDIYQKNEIRLLALKQQFFLALQRYNNFVKQQDELATSDVMVRLLLNRARIEQQKRGRKLLQFIQQHQYDSTIEFLESYEKTHSLNLFDQSILSLTKDFVEIQSTGIIPEKHSDSSNFFSAIRDKDYEFAWKVSSEYVQRFKKHTSHNEAIHLLLKEIMLAKDKLSSENLEPNSVDNKDSVAMESISDVTFYSDAFKKIVHYLLTQDFQTIQDCLDYIDKDNTIEKGSTSSNMNDYTKYPSISKKVTSIESDVLSENQILPVKQKSVVSEDNEEKQLYDRDIEFINQRIDELCEKGILLLQPMSLEREKRIHEIVRKISDIQSFSIGEGNSKRVILRFSPYLSSVDVKTWTKEGNAAYKNGDYDLCIENFKKLLAYREPPASVYARLGLSYMKKNQRDIAVDYLTVANELNKNSNSSIDFSDLIAHLKGMIPAIDKKPFFKMDVSEFDNDIDNYYGIDAIPQISEMLALGLSFDEACANLSVHANEKNIAALVFARECFVQEKYSLGEQYLKKVEQNKEKSPFIISLIEEIRRNRRFYRYRNLEEHKNLVLTPKYRKNN